MVVDFPHLSCKTVYFFSALVINLKLQSNFVLPNIKGIPAQGNTIVRTRILNFLSKLLIISTCLIISRIPPVSI